MLFSFCSCVVVAFQEERQAQAIMEEPGVDNEETNTAKDDEALIEDDNEENETDRTDLENAVNLELIEVVKTTAEH